MAITIEKNQGIRLALASAVPTPLHQSREAGGYYKVRSYHGGGEFFQQENAQLILQCLGDFLPRAIERVGQDGRMEIFYQHFVSGQDLCCRTAALNSGIDVPASELKRLEAAISLLKAKENDAGTDPTKREIIRAFRLPSPQKDPELYRLHGNGSNRRLLVLWGVEKEAGSSLSPQDALNQVPQPKRVIPWWLWLLLALIVLALLGWWYSQQNSSAIVLTGSSIDTPVTILAPEDGNKSVTSSSPTRGTTPASALVILADESKATPKTSSPTKPVENGPLPPQGTPDANSAIVGAPSNRPVNAGGSSKTPTAGANPDGVPMNYTADAKRMPQQPAKAPNGNPSTLTPKESAPNGSESASNSPTTTTRRSTTLPDAPKKDAGLTAGDPTSTPSGQMAANALAKAPTTPLGPHPAPKGWSTTPLSAEIVNARTSAVPKAGKVEMQLSALARDESGKAVTISKVDSWTIDGDMQLDAAGRAITTNGLPVHLTEGAHRVRITGTTDDGRQVTGEADVNVDIAVREESTVRVKQVSKP